MTHRPYRLPSVFEDDYYPYSAKEKYYFLFGKFCSEYFLGDFKFDFKIIDLLKEKYGHYQEFRIFKTQQLYYRGKENREDFKYLIILKKNWLFGINQYNSGIYYDINEEHAELEELKTLISSCIIKSEEKPHYYVIVKANHYEHDLALERCFVRKQDLKIETHYNDDFLFVHQKIESFINEEESGLVILHGIQGAGKTSYIRYLINHCKKRIIYLPVDMVDIIANPSFLPFILNYKDSILIIEDCEELLLSRSSSKGMNSGLINILNLTDGLLGDSIQLKLICTFNAPLTNIDKALLRKGRLKAMYEFKKLTVDKAKSLVSLKNLKISTVTEPMSLAEIFHSSDYNFVNRENNIGFKI